MFLWKDIHFRLAHKHTEFPVEASHPPCGMRCIPHGDRLISSTACAPGAHNVWRNHVEKLVYIFRRKLIALFGFQSTFNPSILLALPDSMTFVLLFLSARDGDAELQSSPFIVHL